MLLVASGLTTRNQTKTKTARVKKEAGGGDTGVASPPTKLAIPGEDISSGRRTDVPAA